MGERIFVAASKRIPTVARVRALRDTRRMTRNPVQVLSGYTAAIGDTFEYHFGGVLRMLVTSRPAIIHHVLKGRPQDFTKSEIQAKRMHEFLGRGLLTLERDTWRRQRRLIQAGFRADRLAALEPTMHRVVEDGLARLDRVITAGVVDASAEMRHLTFAMVAYSLFGASMSEGDIDLVGMAISRVQEFMVRRIVQPYLAPWFHLSGMVRHHQKLRQDGDSVLMRLIASRQTADRGDDLLQLLLDARDPGTGNRMMPQELLAESMQLLVAGHETSSTVLGWTLYLLGRHREALQRLRDECEAVLGDRPLVTSDIERLPFTTAVLKETMRLYPAFWMIDRLACADGEADGVPMLAGTRLALFVHGVHRSPAWWQAPEGFEPDRFFGPERANERACAYLPFGAGPRVCIGSAYAMLQMLMVLAAFVRRYDFALTVDRVIEPRPLLILRAGDRIFLRVQRRKPSG